MARTLIANDKLLTMVEAAVTTRAECYTKLADEIWGFAELGFAERQSAAAQQKILRSEGFTVTAGVGGLPTALLAERGKGQPVIGLLGEFDALAALSQVAGSDREQPVEPGQPGHGCGHNLLGTGAALAAVAAAEALAELGLDGTVRYYACPAEEGGGGKAFMARAGVFDDLDAAFSWHPGTFSSADMNETNAFLQARVIFTGSASHAALTPHQGRSALDAAELMNCGVNYLREHMEDNERIHYAYRDAGGSAANVVQSKVELTYIVRSPSVEGLRGLVGRVERIAEGAAMMTETAVDFTVESGMSPYRPNLELTALMHRQFATIGAPEFDEADLREAARFMRSSGDRSNAALENGVRPLASTVGKSLGSTDVGDVSVVTPMAQIWVAAYARETTFHSWQMVAQGKLRAAHKGMLQAAKVMAVSVVELVRQPDLLQRAQAEHKAHFGEGGYQCPIPAEISAPV